MQIPAGVARDLLPALGAEAVLIEPKPKQLVVPVKGVFHLQGDALFKIRFPFGQKRIGCGLDFDVPFDRHIRRLEQPDCARFPATIREARLQDITAVAGVSEILPVTPKQGLARMTAMHPVLQFVEDSGVHITENLLARRRAMEQCPAANLRVEPDQQLVNRRVEIFVEEGLDPGEEGLHVWAGRPGE